MIVFDTETTGLPNRGKPLDYPEQPWPIQLGFVVADAEFNELGQYDKIIRPPEDTYFHPRAVAVHGISKERAMDEGIPMSQALEEFSHACWLCDGGLHLAYNLAFDDKIMKSAALRTHVELDEKTVVEALYGGSEGDCIMIMAKNYCRVPNYERNGFRQLKLEQVYRRLTGHKLKGAHDALSDVKGALTVFKIMVETTTLTGGQTRQ